MKKRNWVIGILIFLGLTWVVPGLSAQNFTYGMVYTIKGYPDKADELHEAIKKHTAWRIEQGDPWRWAVLREVVGPDLGSYKIVSFGHQLSDFETYQEFLAKGRVHWLDNVMPHVSEITNVIAQVHEDLSIWPEDTATDYITLWSFKFKPGKVWKWLEIEKKWNEAFKEADFPIHYSIETIIAGAEGDQANIVFPSSSMDQAANPDKGVWDVMVDAYGGTLAGDMFQTATSLELCRTTRILKHLPELDVRPKD